MTIRAHCRLVTLCTHAGDLCRAPGDAFGVAYGATFGGEQRAAFRCACGATFGLILEA